MPRFYLTPGLALLGLLLLATPVLADGAELRQDAHTTVDRFVERLKAFAAVKTYHVVFTASHGISTHPDHRVGAPVESTCYAARSYQQVLRLEDPDAFKRGSHIAYVARPGFDSRSGALDARVRYLFESPEALLLALARRAGEAEVLQPAADGPMAFRWRFDDAESRRRFSQVMVKSRFLSGDCVPSVLIRRVETARVQAVYTVTFDPAGRLDAITIDFTCPLRGAKSVGDGVPEHYAAHLSYRFRQWDSATPFAIPPSAWKALR